MSVNDGYVYLVLYSGLYKIGRTQNPKQRFYSYRNFKRPDDKLLACIESCNYKNLERKIRNKFQSQIVRGREWFNLSDNDIKTIFGLLGIVHKRIRHIRINDVDVVELANDLAELEERTTHNALIRLLRKSLPRKIAHIKRSRAK